MAMEILVPVGILGSMGTQFRLSVAPIKSTDWTSVLLNSTTMQGLVPLFKQTWRERQYFFCGA